MHSPLRFMLPLIVHSGDGAPAADAAPSRISCAFVGTLAAPSTTVCLLRCCGVSARDELVRHVGDKPWSCRVTGTDRYGRSLAACTVDSEDIQKWMVRNGWALAFVR